MKQNGDANTHGKLRSIDPKCKECCAHMGPDLSRQDIVGGFKNAALVTPLARLAARILISAGRMASQWN